MFIIYTICLLNYYISAVNCLAIRPLNKDILRKQQLDDDDKADEIMHSIDGESVKLIYKMSTYDFEKSTDHEKDTQYWYKHADKSLDQQLLKIQKLNNNVAKNIILFVGDGMSLPTLFATRIYQDQLDNKPGGDGQLYWETFPFTGLAKTWCIDKQVPDSACTSTAYMTGVKSKYGTVGLNGQVILGNCSTQNNQSNHVNSILKWSQDSGKSTGIVTTTRVTHASPAGGYAHAAERHWESDTDVIIGGYKPSECMDIASQLINQYPGCDFKIIMGGGRKEFIPNTVIDDEGDTGYRSDGKNLIDTWIADKQFRNSKYLYSWNRSTLMDVIQHPHNYDFILGLYDKTHMPYHLEADENDPTLAEMTEAAIKVLKKNNDGFVLFVEGGRIDHAHHRNYANLALDETLELAKAVKIARELTSTDDTLIIVTSDHSHTMSVSGYALRGTKITGTNTQYGLDGLEYTTLSYANGPGYKKPDSMGNRYNISQDDLSNLRYQFPSMVPLKVETHSGEDVAIFASGPWAHLFTGTIEQSNIPHYLGYASCLTPKSVCTDRSARSHSTPNAHRNLATNSKSSNLLAVIIIMLFVIILCIH